MSAVADCELFFHLDTRSFEILYLVDEGSRIHHDSIADHRLHARSQDAAWNQFEDELLLADEHGVPGVVPALITRDDVKLLRKEVYNLAFSFVAPLSAQNNDVAHVGQNSSL